MSIRSCFVTGRLTIPSTLERAAVLVATAVTATLIAVPMLAGAAPLPDAELDGAAARLIKSVPKEILHAPKAKRFSHAARQEEDEAAARYVEEIRVFGDRDPEDVISPRRPPMLAFRDRLEREKTLTPKDITMMGLCFIGLCGANYGPDGAPVEDRAYTRAEKGTNKSSLELSRQFRGTYQ